MFEGIFSAQKLGEMILSLPALLWAISFHEACHGYAAKWLGDPTAERAGRLSLNPLDHFDPVGAVCLFFFHFGWAKPVPIDTRYFKHPKRDIVLVSLAGPAGNVLTAFVCAQIFKFFPDLFTSWAAQQFIVIMIFMNLGLASFNLIPIPPLDGSRVLYILLPASLMEFYYLLERFGMVIILALTALGVTPYIMDPIMSVLFHFLLL